MYYLHEADFHDQAEKENDQDPYLCISDFVASKASGVPDYLGLFANGTFGVETMVEKFKLDVSHLCRFKAWWDVVPKRLGGGRGWGRGSRSGVAPLAWRQWTRVVRR